MRTQTYCPPGDMALGDGVRDDIPCDLCGIPPSGHPFDLICPMTDPAADKARAASVPPARGRTAVMYVEQCSADGRRAPAWIGRVTFARRDTAVYYRGMRLVHVGPRGMVGNFRDPATGIEYWVSAPKRGGDDRHQGGGGLPRIDDDVRQEYEAFRKRK